MDRRRRKHGGCASISGPRPLAAAEAPLCLCVGVRLLLPLALLVWAPRSSCLAVRPVAAQAPTTSDAETKALLAISSALTPADKFANFWEQAGWVASSPTPPCSGNRTNWAFLTCDKEASVTHITLTSRTQVPEQVLSGTLPWTSFAELRSLSELDIEHQNISGAIFPDGMPRLAALRSLTLSYNALTTLGTSVAQLPGLRSLSLAQNVQLTGSLPDGLSALVGLDLADLSYTMLSGSLPASWSSLRNLTALNLQNSHASGSLPASFSSLASLAIFNVPRNALVGTIPATWQALNRTLTYLSVATNAMTGPFPTVVQTLTKLRKLDLGFNKFSGPVPSSFWAWQIPDIDITANYFNGSVGSECPPNTRVDTNCFSSVPNTIANATQRPASECSAFYAVPVAAASTTTTASVNIGMIVGICVGLAAVIVAAALLVFYRLQQRNRLARRLRKGTMQSTREFTLSELKSATKNWSMVLGRGGYGSVYKATFKDGSIVAVKRLDQVSDQGDKEFIREVELLSRVHHRHLVNLVGFCGEKGERALVYEYMGLGSLYDHLHGDCAKEQPLSWDSRIKIAIHVAFGIDYLHYGADPPLIHRDIKSGNILLSDDGYAKVADFGLCKEAPVGVTGDGTAQLVPEATEVRGSFGYLDPEYVNTSVLSEKSDVYSYGVVLLELITGKKSIHDWQPLAYWAEPYLEDPNKLELLVDPQLDGEYDVHELQILCDIARSCTYDQAAMRPAIRDVAQALVENLGRVVASTTSDSDPSTYDSSELASSSDPTDSSNMSATFSAPSEYSFRNAASEAFLKAAEEGKEGGKHGAYMVSTGPSGDKPPVPVGKHFEDTV